MRITRMRAAMAGVLSVASIALATPAFATPVTATPAGTTATPGTPSPSPTTLVGTPAAPTAGPTTAAALAPTPTPTLDPSGTPGIGGGATPSVDPSATASADASATPTAAAAATPTASSTPTGGTGNPTLDGFLSLLPFKVPLDKKINGIQDFDVNPLYLTFACNGSVPSWKLRNTADKAFGFGWFDTSLGGGLLQIGPKQTVDVPSKALAVIGSPWDAATKNLLVTVPTVGVSNCSGGPAGGAPVALPAPAPLPAAAPAATHAVSAEPYYTR